MPNFNGISTEYQQDDLVQLLHKFEEFFDGTLGIWKTDQVEF